MTAVGQKRKSRLARDVCFAPVSGHRQVFRHVRKVPLSTRAPCAIVSYKRRRIDLREHFCSLSVLMLTGKSSCFTPSNRKENAARIHKPSRL